MARETVHIVQAYVVGRGKGLKAEQQVGCKDAAETARKAERLAPLREGVIAYSVSANVEMGDYDENPIMLFKAGRLPPPWEEALIGLQKLRTGWGSRHATWAFRS